jgi:hypothetical protein
VEQAQGIQFEPTLDERVEVTVRFLRHTAGGRALRRRALWKSVFVFGLAMFIVSAAIAGVTDVEGLAGLSIVVLIFGAVIAFMFHRVNDWGLEQRVRASLERRVAEQGAAKCEIQLRKDGVWVRDLGVEQTFPWRDATRIDELGDSIEMSFQSALVVVRGRAFSTANERALSLQRARVLAGLADPRSHGSRHSL